MINKIINDYANKRKLAEEQLEKRTEELHLKIPRLKEIELEKRNMLFKIGKLSIMNKEMNQLEINSLQDKVNCLNKEKQAILDRNNINKSYLEIQYDCSECRDTGYINILNSKNEFIRAEKCKCFKQQLIEERYKNSNLSNLLESQNMNNFDLNIFSEDIVKGERCSAKERIIEILDEVTNFINNFNEKNTKSLLLYGNTGLGKTYMCSCISKRLIDKGYTVLYQMSGDLMEITLDKKFERSPENSKKYEDIFECDLLIIDDLGTEPINNATIPEMFSIINKRLIMNKKTVISTNLGLAKIIEIYSERIGSRIIEEYKLLQFLGEDIRIKKALGGR